MSSVGGSFHEVASYDGVDQHVNQEIQQLARQLTSQSVDLKGAELVSYLSNMSDVPGADAFNSPDERLDPESDNFDSGFWVKNLRKVRDSDPDYYKPSKLGIGYKNLVCSGVAVDADYAANVLNAPLKFFTNIYNNYINKSDDRYFNILKSMDGLILPGEVTVVLGRPGAGCSTLLKTIASQTYGFKVNPNSIISYDGLTPKEIDNHHRGDVIYSAETDVHFPLLTVGQTLEFAAKMRTPQNRGNVERETYAKHLASVYMATYGLSHTRHTQVGNDFIKGVSGGERKRVSIAEVSLSGANLQCWDNATRGLDAATALEFIKALRTSASVLKATPLIAIYQCSQDAYDLFDKAVVLYEGYQIFFGKANKGKQYFEEMGYFCPPRQTTSDFLTSITNPAERIIKRGYEAKVPRTPEQFEAYWRESNHYKQLIKDIDQYFEDCKALNTKEEFAASHTARQSNHVSKRSPYTLSFGMQLKYLMQRGINRQRANILIPILTVISQVIMALIVSSVFYNLDNTTGTLARRGNAMILAMIFSAFASLTELVAVFESRQIVEKHKMYALYRPSADALAAVIVELPVKVLALFSFTLPFYFMVNLRRTPGHYFVFTLFSFLITLVMSHFFRTLAAIFKTLVEAYTYSPFLIIVLVIYSGYMLPVHNMLGWARWMNYVDPLAYAFESLMANEFQGRHFECSAYYPSGPGYENVPFSNKICAVVSAQAGQLTINGTEYIDVAFGFKPSHTWRNFGIVLGFILFLLFTYCIIFEYNKGAMQKGDITLFLRSGMMQQKAFNRDEEVTEAYAEKASTEKASTENLKEVSVENSESGSSGPQNIYHWKDLTYQVKAKEGQRVLLDHVDGWVKPGQLTALMGSSGAGKTTLLNCLSERLTVGVITDGLRMVNGHSLDSSFQRSIGYAQQQDIHLDTSTVRESLQFSAYLRQSNKYTKKEKDEYVEYIIDLLEMSKYADAVVGVQGEGLNVEQRKRLTIGVELAARPKLLLFLDEPTSGLDSQTAWSVCKLMRKLANHGQAILCTIHQPSAMLLSQFDRLLFLQKGGQTVYFGDLGENCSTLINYFEKHGADPCPEEANPAEWMLHVVGAAPGSHAKQDYFEVWKNSTEYEDVHKELDYFETELAKTPMEKDSDSDKKYASTFFTQFWYTNQRIAVSFWRSPSYIYSKLWLIGSSGLILGFSFFKADNTAQGLQSQLFGLFQAMVPIFSMLQQLFPVFVKYRDIYEAREAPSRTFSWVHFILSLIIIEIIYNFIMGTVFYFVWAYPIGFYRNAQETNSVHERGALLWLVLASAFAYGGSLGTLFISFNESIENAGNLGSLVVTLFIQFNGIMFSYHDMPGFWKFLYRVNPFTYMVHSIFASGLSNAKAQCADYELLRFPAPDGETCKEYMADFIKQNGGGFLVDPASKVCEFCRISNSNQFLEPADIFYSERWRNYGIFVCYFVTNVFFTLGAYYLARVPKSTRRQNK